MVPSALQSLLSLSRCAALAAAEKEEIYAAAAEEEEGSAIVADTKDKEDVNTVLKDTVYHDGDNSL